MNGWIEGQKQGQIFGWTEGWMEGQKDGQTEIAFSRDSGQLLFLTLYCCCCVVVVVVMMLVLLPASYFTVLFTSLCYITSEYYLMLF